MSQNFSDLTRFAQDLDKASKEAPKKVREFKKNIAKRYREILSANAPPDDEGRLRASLEKRSFKGDREYVEKHSKDGVEVGTSVYYASMVNDGHIVGKRPVSMRAHRKMSVEERKAAGAAGGKAWVSGAHFFEKSETEMDAELPRIVEKLADDLLKEASG